MMVVNDIGTLIRLDTGTSLSGATESVIRYKKPDGTCGEWEASINDTVVEYTTEEGDIDQAGMWELQAYVALASWSGSSSTVKVPVGSELVCS